MKIVHVVYSMEMGGAESLVAQLCRMQRAHGHEVSVLAQAKLGTLGERMRADGIRVDVVGTGNPLARFPRWARFFRELQPEVVHCHNVAPTIQAAPAARLMGARVVVSTRHSLVAPPYDKKMEMLYGVAARFCDWIVGICDATCENLRHAPLARRRHIVRVYNGTAPLARIAEAERQSLREQGDGNTFSLDGAEAGVDGEGGLSPKLPAGAPTVPTIFVFVGRLAAIKDLPTMLRAFAAAMRQRDDLRLWVVGDGPERARLETLVAELGVATAVRFWGERHDVERFFNAADVFTMSSVSEGLPMSLLQAMSVGKPALVTDVGGMAEVVRLAGGGVTTPVGDDVAMSQSMLALARDEVERRLSGERAYAAYQQAFTLEAMNEAYMTLYKSRL